VIWSRGTNNYPKGPESIYIPILQNTLSVIDQFNLEFYGMIVQCAPLGILVKND
jgi:hypothetical protein